MSASSSSLRPHVRARREGANLRPAELARLAGITRQALHSIETGNSTPNTLVAFGLARALGCTVDELFSFVAQEVGATLAAPIAGDARVQLAQVGERLLAFPLGGTPGFHQLADGIARLPPGGAGEASSARVELSGSLDRPRRTAVLVGCDPSLELLSGHVARHTPEVRVLWRSASSQAALEALGRGEAHAAGIHLWDAAAGLSNLPFVERAFPGQPMHLFTLWSWEQGLMLPPGNPAGLSGPADLLRPGLRFVNREPGAGSRLLLDAWLSAQGLGPARRHALPGYRDEVYSHLEAAQRVAAGGADLAPGPRSAAQALGLDFVPLQRERFDLVVPGAHLSHPAVMSLLAAAQTPAFRSELAVLGGYDPAHAGEFWRATA